MECCGKYSFSNVVNSTWPGPFIKSTHTYTATSTHVRAKSVLEIGVKTKLANYNLKMMSVQRNTCQFNEISAELYLYAVACVSNRMKYVFQKLKKAHLKSTLITRYVNAQNVNLKLNKAHCCIHYQFDAHRTPDINFNFMMCFFFYYFAQLR